MRTVVGVPKSRTSRAGRDCAKALFERSRQAVHRAIEAIEARDFSGLTWRFRSKIKGPVFK